MQCSLRALVFVYIFGGLTFVPLVAIAAIAFIYYTSPLKETVSAEKAAEAEKNEERPITPNSASGEELRDDDELEGVDAHKVGWLQVSREYDSSIGLIGPEKIPGNNRGKYMDKMRSLLDRQDTPGPNNAGFLKVKAAMYYAVLKHGNLFLYETEDQLDVKHVIVLQHFITSMWPLHEDDNELFLKPNAICLSRKDGGNGLVKPNSNSTEEPPKSSDKPQKPRPPEHSYFLFPTTNIEKEDWYFAILRGSKTTSASQKSLSPTDPTVAAVPARFDPRHMFSLIQTVHSTDAQLQTRWLNALIGRIFLATYQTKHIEEVCIRKITKKIARVNRPAFLSDIKVQKVVVGTQAPVFTLPRLKELSAAGEFAADVNVAYNGGFRMEIATVATLQLGSRFKPRQVSLSLAVTIKKLEGKLLLRMKKPPSNRLWVGFYEAPTMDLAIEPIVSSRQITYTMVLRAIESRIREAIEESIVLPNMDDSAFCPTNGEFYRGGIWQRKEEESVPDPNDPAASGDVEGVEKQMENATESEPAAKEASPEHSESGDSLEKLEPKRRFKTTLRSPAKAQPILPPSDPISKGRVSRSSSFTSVASAPAVVGADFVNVAGTSPSRDESRKVAEAAARAIVNRQRMNDSPKLDLEGNNESGGSRPISIKSASSLDDDLAELKKVDEPTVPSMIDERPESAPPNTQASSSQVTDVGAREVPQLPPRRSSSIASEKNAIFASRVSQATDAAKDMLKTRLNTYLAKRQQSKLQKQILTNDRDELVNSIKPRTRRLTSEVSTNLEQKNDNEDIDSGPLPFENKKSPLFAPSEFSALSSPGYGPSAMMTIPSTMSNARPSMSSSDHPTESSLSPALPPRPGSVKASGPPQLPPRSAPRPIPRRPVPEQPPPSQSAESSAAASPEDHCQLPKPANNEEDDLMILHIPSDDEDALESAGSIIKETGLSPTESQHERRRVVQEEEAVLEPSSYSSSKSRRPSVAKDLSLRQWSEKQTQDTDMPEIMEQGLMG